MLTGAVREKLPPDKRNSDLAISSTGKIQTEIALNNPPPGVHDLCLLRKLWPSCHSGANLLDDGFGAATLHHGTFGAGAEVHHRESVALAVHRHLMARGPVSGRIVA